MRPSKVVFTHPGEGIHELVRQNHQGGQNQDAQAKPPRIQHGALEPPLYVTGRDGRGGGEKGQAAKYGSLNILEMVAT